MTRLLVEHNHQAYEMEQNENGTATLFFVGSNTVARMDISDNDWSLLDDEEEDTEELTAEDIAMCLGHMDNDGNWIE